MIEAAQQPHRRPRERDSSLADEGGFTIVELMVAMAIFAIVIVATGVVMGSALNLNRQNQSRDVAANLGAAEMDVVRSTQFKDLPIGRVERTQAVGAITYTIVRDTEWLQVNATTDSCQISNANADYLRVTVRITWPEMRGTQPVTTQTVITPPVGAYDPENGHVSVRVMDAQGGPVDAVPVVLSKGTATWNQTTGTSGCAFFAYKAAGAYTVSLNKPGYVDDQGVAGPVQSVTIAAGATTNLQFSYDEAATLSVTLQGRTGLPPATGTAPNDVGPVTIANTHLTPAGMKTYAGTGATRTITVFPWADGYAGYAGYCAAANPVGKNGSTPYYSGGVMPSPVAVTPGGTTAMIVPMPEVAVTITRTGTGAPVSGRYIVATPVSGTGTGCTTINLGQTGSDGKLQVALPYGTWQIRQGTSYTSTTQMGSNTVFSPTDPAGPKSFSAAVT